MSFELRAIEREDLPAVARLLASGFPDEPYSVEEWERCVDWVCFPTEFGDDIPRGLVVAGDQGIVAHIGLTVTRFTDGARSLKLVHTVNWIVDRSQKAGFWAVQLIVRAASLADAAIIVGGNAESQRIFPKVGYERRLEVGRYLKIKRPAHFLARADSAKDAVRQAGKLGVYAARRVTQGLGRSAQRDAPRAELRLVDSERDAVEAFLRGRPRDGAGRVAAMRNALDPDVMSWYARCPQGEVKLFEIRTEGSASGIASVLVGTRGGSRFATILSLDTRTDDVTAWMAALRAIDELASRERVTHVNALGCYAPWCEALERSGYGRLRTLPLWVRDKAGTLADVTDWHLSAIEGDLGYLLL